MEQREMNFWDLCVALGSAIGRGCSALWQLLARMIRLTYRYWWVVVTLLLVALALAWYITRPDNTKYRVNAVAMLNGASVQQFEQAYMLLKSGCQLPDEEPVKTYIKEQKAFDFRTFRVIDCLHDGVADYVDFRGKSSPTDTTKVQMQDRLCLQFTIKNRDLALLPEIENALLAWLNANPAMQQSYAGYLENMRAEVAFNHTQAQKLDSLTSNYYFSAAMAQPAASNTSNGVTFYGDRKVTLFLDKIYAQHRHMQQADYRIQFATAPVTLENHFAVDPKPVNGRMKYLLVFFLLGWLGGCLIAELIDRRKAIAAWLKE